MPPANDEHPDERRPTAHPNDSVTREESWSDQQRAFAHEVSGTLRRPSASETTSVLAGLRRRARADAEAWHDPGAIADKLPAAEAQPALEALARAGITERAITTAKPEHFVYRLAQNLAPDGDAALSPNALKAQRSERFEQLRAHFQAEGPDCTTPGAARGPARYALLSENAQCAHFLNYAAERSDLERIAAADLLSGWTALRVFDLDELHGEEPPVGTDDVVSYQGRELHVVNTCEDLAKGIPCLQLWLDSNPDSAIDDAEFIEIDSSEVEVLERAAEDERLPKAYEVAEIRTIVVFNTTPNP
jgi:hypothetical protein